jgi:hypothetical protein
MLREHVQSTANAHTTGGRDGISHRTAGRLAVQIPSPGTPGIRAFLMTAAHARAVHTASSPSSPTPCCDVHTALEP